LLTLQTIRSGVAQVAPLYDIKKATLFGSYANGTQTEHSDVDLLVEFAERPISLFKIAGVKLKLEEVLGKAVDVIHSPIPAGSLIEIDKEVLVYEQ
jgi:predicted nucleotidyltransferase